MSEQKPNNELPSINKAAPSELPPEISAPEEQVKQLSPEEQMALFEKDLKENDWGHQPC